MPKSFSLADRFREPGNEASLLAAISKNQSIYWDLHDHLIPEAFSLENKTLFLKMAKAIEAQEELAPMDGVEATEEPFQMATHLADLYRRRLVAELHQKGSQDLDGDRPATELITDLELNLAKVQTAFRQVNVGQIRGVDSIFPDLLQEVKTAYDHRKLTGNSTRGLPTGIEQLDERLGGLQAGVHILAAEPGCGKTTLALQIASHVSSKGYPVIFVTFEETAEKLTLKAICSRAKLSFKEFIEGNCDPQKLEDAYREYGPSLSGLSFIGGNPGTTVAQVKAKAMSAIAKMRSKATAEKRPPVDRCLIVVDYLQNWASAKKEFSDFRHVVGALVGELRSLALSLKSPVLVISSQNRGGQNSSDLTSLKESGDLEYTADSAMFLVANQSFPVSPPARGVDLILRKNRYGEAGSSPMELVFKPDIGSFEPRKSRR